MLRDMTEYDAIVIGAGHNGLTAALVLQRAGLRTLCLEANTYTGGMSATVELIDGFKFEIAGSIRFPTAPKIEAELGLGELPTIQADIMSVNLGENGEEAMVFHSDPMAMMTHLNEKHGMDAVMGMAGLYGWASGPGKALGRFDALSPPKTIDEMYACAADENERRAIHEMLFGSAMDVVDRFLPDREKHAVIRGMLAFLAVNATYRGPYTPGSATCLAFAMAIPEEGGSMTSKIKGGIGALAEHLREIYLQAAGEVRYRTKVDRILVDDGRVTGVQLHDGSTISAPVVVSNLAPDTTLLDLVGAEYLPSSLVSRLTGRDHRASFLQMHFALDGLPRYLEPYGYLNEPGMQLSVGMFGSAESQQRQWDNCRWGEVPDNPALSIQIPSVHDPDMAPEGKHTASVFAYAFPAEAPREDHGRLKKEMAQKVVQKISRYAPNFPDVVLRQITFAPYHMNSMFGAPNGDYCHGLLQPELMGPNRPGPKGFIDEPIPIEGLYLGGAGCHGGPGITFIPGYNAGYQVLEDAGR